MAKPFIVIFTILIITELDNILVSLYLNHRNSNYILTGIKVLDLHITYLNCDVFITCFLPNKVFLSIYKILMLKCATMCFQKRCPNAKVTIEN